MDIPVHCHNKNDQDNYKIDLTSEKGKHNQITQIFKRLHKFSKDCTNFQKIAQIFKVGINIAFIFCNFITNADTSFKVSTISY